MKKNRGGIMSTEKTKLKFLNSFLELMAVRPVNKITVKDITNLME